MPPHHVKGAWGGGGGGDFGMEFAQSPAWAVFGKQLPQTWTKTVGNGCGPTEPACLLGIKEGRFTFKCCDMSTQRPPKMAQNGLKMLRFGLFLAQARIAFQSFAVHLLFVTSELYCLRGTLCAPSGSKTQRNWITGPCRTSAGAECSATLEPEAYSTSNGSATGQGSRGVPWCGRASCINHWSADAKVQLKPRQRGIPSPSLCMPFGLGPGGILFLFFRVIVF